MLYFIYTTHYYVEFKFMACLLVFFNEQIRITEFQCANEYKSHSKFKRKIKKKKKKQDNRQQKEYGNASKSSEKSYF